VAGACFARKPRFACVARHRLLSPNDKTQSVFTIAKNAWRASGASALGCSSAKFLSARTPCGFGQLRTHDSYLVDPASSHMLVSKIKPCMSKYKQVIRRNCRWLLKSVIVYLMIPYYMDTRSNSRANTCINDPPQGGQYLLDKKPIGETHLPVNHNNFSNRMLS
jgi:hypothetical protein